MNDSIPRPSSAVFGTPVCVEGVGRMGMAIALDGARLFAGAGPVETILLGTLLFSSSRYVAAEFSYYAAVPPAVALALFRSIRYFILDGGSFNGPVGFSLLAAFGGAAIMTFALTRPCLHMLKRRDTSPFAVYRIILGVAAIVVAAVTA